MTAPTLIIGLGGIGSDIVSMVELKTRERGIDSTNIKFLLVDTDNIALSKHRENGFAGKTIRISQNIKVKSCLNQNQEAGNKWYPRNGIFNNKTLTDGAGQVRAISRLALEDAIAHEELKPLYDEIYNLHLTHRNFEGKTLRIAVVSSLAGGTGSGIILPFAIHLGDYLTSTYPDNGYNMSGFFMMPDIVLMNNGSNAVERISLNSNAYATIKELDAFIQKNAGTKKNLKAVISLPEQVTKDGIAIYNFNFLFGILNNDTSNLTLKSVLQYENMMADSIFMAFCSSINELNSTREDNKFKHLAIMLSLAEEKRYNPFGSIGVATLQYPYYEIRKYLTMLWIKDILKNEWFQYDEEYENDDTLDAMHDSMKEESTKYYGRLNGVSQWIHTEAKNIVINKQKKQREKKGLWEAILREWEIIFQETYGNSFDMDIISALEWEVKKTCNINDVKAVMESKINNSVDKLSAPFLKAGSGRGITTIEENYFHSSLNSLNGDKKSIVDELLAAHNGVTGTLGVDKYTIYFYKSMFGVDVNELYLFDEEGIYYRDYQQITRYMHMNDSKEELLTPHIDRTWHRSDILPEMSKSKQVKEMCFQWEAMIYGIIEEKIARVGDVYIINVKSVYTKQCSNLFQAMDIIREFKEVREEIRGDKAEYFKETSQENADYKEGEVKTKGYISSEKFQDWDGSDIVKVNEIPQRVYKVKKILKIQSGSEYAYVFAVFLKELFFTLFPNCWQLLSVGMKNNEGLEGRVDRIINEDNTSDLIIYIIEDSPLDLGLLDTIGIWFMDILNIFSDYMDWLEEMNRDSIKWKKRWSNLKKTSSNRIDISKVKKELGIEF